MEKKQIIIVSNTYDIHADSMIQILQEMAFDPIRLNTTDIPFNTIMSLEWENGVCAGNGSITIRTNGRVIDVNDIRSIWWRRPRAFNFPPGLTEQELGFARDEMQHFLRGLWASLDCYWISYPEYIRQASWKGHQLQRAAQSGFTIPRTLITTDPQKVRFFYEMCDGAVVYKVLTDPLLGATKLAETHPDQVLPGQYRSHTTLITPAELALLDSVQPVPCLFQEYIPKQFELRVTVIGDEIFAAEIHSQAHERTIIDWRHYDVNIPYRKATLPEEIAERCLALVKSYHLNYSAIDLILTPDGRYVFLELNPNGQFLFVEERVPELKITSALAACLIRGANS